MLLTGLDVFDATIHRTNIWLKELMQELNWSDHRRSYLVFRSVLHTLRDHLPVNEAIYFGEQLPMLIRGFYFAKWEPAGTPPVLRSKGDFLSALAANLSRLGETSTNPEIIARAVFRLLDRKITDGEIHDVHHLIPVAVMDLWPPALRAA